MGSACCWVKGVIWCDFKFSFVFGVLQAVREYIRSVKLQRLKSQTQRDILLKVKTRPRLPKTRPHMSTSLCGKICITPPNCLCKERRCSFYSRSSRCMFLYTVRGVTFLSHAWGIRPITTDTHWIAGQSEHTALFKMMSFVNIDVFQIRGATIMFFFYLKPRKLGMLRYHNTILLQYEVHDTIFIGIFTKTNEVHFIVKWF